MDHVIKVGWRYEDNQTIYHGGCSCGYRVQFESTEKEHITEDLKAHIANIPNANKTGFAR